MKVDAHQHFWKYSHIDYPWIQSNWPIRRDFLPEHLEPELTRIGFNASIAVQARQTWEETRWLLDLASKHPFIAGVVGWGDLRNPEFEKQLEPLAANPKLVGLRHVVQDEPDDRFMLGTDFLGGIGKLRRYELAYDILIYPKQLPAAIELVRKFPNQLFVLDHLAKPPIRAGDLDPWRNLITELSRSENVFCKLSGLVTEAAWNTWKKEDFNPYLEIALENFSPARLMIGSDWPVALNAAKDYQTTMQVILDYISNLSESEQAQITGQTARKVYGL